MPSNIAAIDRAVAAGPFAPTWESLAGFRTPTWYIDGKFGIFIHWGVYSVPAFGNEWYARNMYLPDRPEFMHHVETYAPHTEFGYKDFISDFTGSGFDPAAWADLFRRAGATYVVPVAEHHDGFPLYDCSFTDWSAAKLGPRRDVIGELAAAVDAAGMVFGASYHRAENWWFYNGGVTFPSDVQDPRHRGLYGRAQPKETQPDQTFLDEWLLRLCELVDRYQPQLLWFDWWIEEPAFAPYLRRFAAYYYNRGASWGKQVAINYKHAAFPTGTAVWDIERGQLAALREPFWQTDTAVAKNSWGYIAGLDYKTPTALIGDLVDIVSKNGSLLLNIGPRPDGTIPDEDQAVLLEIGRWLSVNGQAIYGSRPWRVFGEGPTQVVEGSFQDTAREAFTGADIRFTVKDGALYAVLLGWPGASVTVTSLGTDAGLWESEIERVELLGHEGPLTWQHSAQALTVTLPDQRPCDHAYTLKITAR